jgi:DNA-binding response OmpR family regulator
MTINILVVDDDDLMTDMVTSYLKMEGYSADAAEGFNTALELIRSNEYDVMLIDKNMPGLDGNPEGGIDLLNYVRSQSLPSEIIMMTGNPTVETAILAMKLGAFDYIIKPFSLSDLKEKLKKLLEYKGFINSDYMIDIYHGIRGKLFKVIDIKSSMQEMELDHALLSLSREIDRLFYVLRESERLILTERESLARVASLTEELKENMAEEDPLLPILEKILCLANTRL